MDHLVQASVIHGRHEEAALKIAAPELDGPQQAPSRVSELIQECAWKHGDRLTADRDDVQKTRDATLTEEGLLFRRPSAQGLGV